MRDRLRMCPFLKIARDTGSEISHSSLLLEIHTLYIVLLKTSLSLSASHRTTPAYMSSQKTQFGTLVKGANLNSEATLVPFGPSCTR